MKKHTKRVKLPKGAWFYKVRGSYLPATWQGWLTYVPFIVFLLWSWTYIFNTTDSVVTAILLVFSAWIASVVVMTWVAKNKS